MDLVLGEEHRREAALRAAMYQQALRLYHCRNIRSRTLEVGDLVLRRVLSREGLHKLSPMWEGPFRVAISPGLVPRAWRHRRRGAHLERLEHPAPPEVLPMKQGPVPVKKGPVPVKKGRCL